MRKLSRIIFVGSLLITQSAAAQSPTVLSSWGITYSGGLGIDAAGAVYVTEYDGPNRIKKYSNDGVYLGAFGSQGSGPGQFDWPGDVEAYGTHLFVVDTRNNRVQKLTSDGTFVLEWSSGFNLPRALAIDGGGDVYVADTENHQIQKFTSSGAFIQKWGSQGSGGGQFDRPMGIAVDASGNVYVSDKNNHRIQKFSSTGSFLAQWGSFGTAHGQLWAPGGVAVDADGNIYVGDGGNHRIQKFDPSGNFLLTWGQQGSGSGDFNFPWHVAVDAGGHVFVQEDGNKRIQEFGGDQPVPTMKSTWGRIKSTYAR